MTRKHLLFILALLCGQVSFAQLIGFETGIPKQFQTSDKGKITLSTQYYKEGKQSLKWDFSRSVPNSTLLLNSLSPLMSEWKIHTNNLMDL